jgi:hypothetical protein
MAQFTSCPENGHAKWTCSSVGHFAAVKACKSLGTACALQGGIAGHQRDSECSVTTEER